MLWTGYFISVFQQYEVALEAIHILQTGLSILQMTLIAQQNKTILFSFIALFMKVHSERIDLFFRFTCMHNTRPTCFDGILTISLPHNFRLFELISSVIIQ